MSRLIIWTIRCRRRTSYRRSFVRSWKRLGQSFLCPDGSQCFGTTGELLKFHITQWLDLFLSFKWFNWSIWIYCIRFSSFSKSFIVVDAFDDQRGQSQVQEEQLRRWFTPIRDTIQSKTWWNSNSALLTQVTYMDKEMTNFLIEFSFKSRHQWRNIFPNYYL